MRSMNISEQRGFTLVELLVVMIVIGILAGTTIPLLLSQKRKAQETAVKSDVKAIAKEVTGFYVDGTGPLVLAAGTEPYEWQLTSGPTVVATGTLSASNGLSAAAAITSDASYCVAVVPSHDRARTWAADQDGLRVGDC